MGKEVPALTAVGATTRSGSFPKGCSPAAPARSLDQDPDARSVPHKPWMNPLFTYAKCFGLAVVATIGWLLSPPTTILSGET